MIVRDRWSRGNPPTGVARPAWVRRSKLRSRYVSPVYAGDTITVSGQIAAVETDAGATRIDAEVWCENQSGQKVTVGTASVWL